MKTPPRRNLRFDPFIGCPPRTWLPALIFTFFLYIFEGFHLETGLPGSISLMQSSGDPVFGVVLFLYIVLSFYLLLLCVLMLIGSSAVFKLMGLSIFTVSTLIQYGYQKALGRFADHSDVAFALSATPEQRSFALSAFTDWAALIPIVLLIVLSASISRKASTISNRASGVIIIVLSIFFLHFAYIQPLLFGGAFYNNSFGAFLRTSADLAIHEPIKRIVPLERSEVQIPTSSIHTVPNKNIVMIFDESVRSDHLSLNGYSRPTTPFLERLHKEGILLNWGTAVSAVTSSHPSYEAFISGATPENITEFGLGKINNFPSIFQYAKAMDYRTTYIDGQIDAYWGGLKDDVEYIDQLTTLGEIRTLGQPEQWEVDGKIALLINQKLLNSTGNFIFVYKRGTHFPYEDNYPEEEIIWKPIYKYSNRYEIPTGEHIDAVINSYDNSIKYNLDSFFRILLENDALNRNNSIILYTADHGQSFYANGRAGHGGRTKEEAMVPFFALGFQNEDLDTSFPVTHAAIFSSILDLFDYPKELRSRPYSPSIFDDKSMIKLRHFSTPQGEKIQFDELPLFP